MSSDINVGDVVVCVDDGWLMPVPPYAPRRGSVHRVNGVYQGICVNDGRADTFLDLVGLADGWWAGRFRRLNDGEDDAKTIALIKNCQPVKQGEPV